MQLTHPHCRMPSCLSRSDAPSSSACVILSAWCLGGSMRCCWQLTSLSRHRHQVCRFCSRRGGSPYHACYTDIKSGRAALSCIVPICASSDFYLSRGTKMNECCMPLSVMRPKHSCLSVPVGPALHCTALYVISTHFMHPCSYCALPVQCTALTPTLVCRLQWW